jgi:Holliday junction DNA helicase RuvB
MALGALELLQIDACGFDNLDRAILSAIIDNPVGVDTLAAAVGEEADTIGDVYEPYLFRSDSLPALHAAAWPPSGRIRI